MPLRAGRTALDRRALLTGALGAAAATTLAPVGPFVRPARAAEASYTRINGRLGVISGLGGNILVYAGDAGLVLVDSGAAGHTDALLDRLSQISDLGRVQTLFNTHWHLEQVGSNAAIHDLGATIIAHAKTLAHLATPYYLPDEDRYQPPLPAAALPTESFLTEGSVNVDDATIRYGYLLEAHTEGDIYVLFQADKLIAAGDAISPERDPVLDWYGGGWLGGRIDALERLLDMSDAGTRFVPSYGPIVDRSYVETEHALMLALYEILWERIRAGESADDILASGALEALPRRFDDPGKLLYDAHKSMWAHYNTLSPDIV
jgi:glyoxylase-like metal-dependent hydrolase (beta-lactamase superfamily II)